MPTPEIVEKVRKLHTELGEVTPSPATAQALEPIKQAVATVMLEPAYPPHFTSLRDKLLFAYVGFEIDHPKLAQAMQGVITSMNAAGL